MGRIYCNAQYTVSCDKSMRGIYHRPAIKLLSTDVGQLLGESLPVSDGDTAPHVTSDDQVFAKPDDMPSSPSVWDE